MGLSAITVVSLLMMFGGSITAEENREDEPNVFRPVRYESDYCCSRIDKQEKILKDISSATKKLTKDVGEIRTEVEDDIPSELKRQAVELEKLSSEMKRQAVGQRELSAELKEVKASVSEISINLNRHTEDLLVHDARVKEQGLLLSDLTSLVKEMHDSLLRPKDCSDIRALGHSTSSVYRVYPGSHAKRIKEDAYCDMTTPGGNWLVFQRRKDGSVNFERTWNEYQNGFGYPDGEFWLGNEALSLLTSNGKYRLRIDMEDFDGQKRYAEYSTFSVGSSADKYRLTVTGYTGNAGESLLYHSGMQFSTKDADNDVYSGNCPQISRGAWWYKNCLHSNLNGLYLRGPHKSFADGIEWLAFRGYKYSLKMTEMKIAAVN